MKSLDIDGVVRSLGLPARRERAGRRIRRRILPKPVTRIIGEQARLPETVNRHAKVTHLGGSSAFKIDPPVPLTSAQNCAEERAGATDGKRIEDPASDIARWVQHPFGCASDGFVAEHDQEVSEGCRPAVLPPPCSAGSSQVVRWPRHPASGVVRAGHEAASPGASDGAEAVRAARVGGLRRLVFPGSAFRAGSEAGGCRFERGVHPAASCGG